MWITYIGPSTERVVDFPIPFLAEANREGSLRFTAGEPLEVKKEWADQLLAVEGIGETFMKSEPKKVESVKAVKP